MESREDLSVEAALDAFVVQAAQLEENFFLEEPVDLSEFIEPEVESEVEPEREPDLSELIEPDDITVPTPRITALSQRVLVVSMFASAAISALAVVALVRPAPIKQAAASVPRPRIEVVVPRIVRKPAPAPVVMELAPAPAPAPVAHARAPEKKRVLTAKVSHRSWSANFAD